MRKNTTLSLMRDNKVALGTWLQLHSYQGARLLAAQGLFHWLLVDFEHTPVDRSTAAQILSAISDVSGGLVTPLGRVSVGSADQIKHALDAGAQGITVPMIKNASEVRDAVRFTRYPPDGERGAGGLSPHLGFGVSRPTYIQCANREILFGVQIETAEAIENLDEILDVKGVDMCFIGPNDLHLALGYPALFWSAEPRFVQAVETVRAACRKRRIPLGTLCKDLTGARARIADGYTFVGLGSDAHFMLQYAGIQYGELHGIPEPLETWCNTVKCFDGPDRDAAPASAPAVSSATGDEDATARTVRAKLRSQAFKFDPNANAFDVDPFPTYAHMRDYLPVYWWAEAQGWVVTHYDDVMTLLHDERFSVEVKDWEHGGPELPDEQLTTHQLLARHGLFWMPNADHTRVRKVLAPLFTPRAVEALKQAFQSVVDDLLTGIAGRRTVDIVTEFTAQYPLRAITHVLGIPKERQEKFIQFGSAVIDAFYPAISPEALREKMAFLPCGVAMLEEILAARREKPGDDFFSKLIHAEKQGERLTQKEIISMVALMISAGCEPPRHLMTFALYHLLKHPDQLELLRQEPELLRNAVLEIGRFDSFGKLNLPRFPLEDLEIRGVRIPKGQQVFGVFASALRDPKVFPDADRLDIRRDQSTNILYGSGPHICLGTALAQLMTETAVDTLVRRFPKMKLLGEPTYTRNAFFRKIISLPIELQLGGYDGGH